MARPRAPDHDSKRLAILQRAAELFAAHGYDRASLTMLARACDMSKSLLYHYYADKSRLLFDIIHDHLEHLLAVIPPPEPADSDRCAPEPRAHLVHLTEALLEAYRKADHQHHVQINQMHLLPQPQQRILKDMERTLVHRFATAIAPCVPPPVREGALLKPLTMSLFGMVNWSYLWFRDNGRVRRSDYAAMVVTLVVDGAARLGRPPTALAHPGRVPAHTDECR